MKKVNLISKADMKNIIGGLAEKPKSYKCCPDGYGNGTGTVQIVCSDCVEGKDPVCTQGNVTLC